ncbi:MAG: hypothetical protein A2Z48_03960 [Actinobacteria bacterium RBG_19FT_COMBO_70_19]|jgi:hypothetical protein|nr:MAG: hypothetical protein A2Z48_03960 [Actinobacteria bacterium RBG_19FT_COMBO_70_19]
MSQSGVPIDLPPPPPLRPSGVGEILSAAFDLYARYWRTLIPLVAVVVVPLTILQYALDAVLWEDVVRTTASGGVEIVGSTEQAWQAAAGGFVLGLITLFVTLALVGALAWAAAGALVGREPDLGESYRVGVARMWSVLLVSLLTGLAVAGGFILLIVPGLIFLARFAVAVPALVVEGKRGRAALSRSWNLVIGHSWPVFGTLLVAGLIAGAVSGVLTVPFSGPWFVRGLLAGIGSAITTPFTGLVFSLVYFDLRVRKDGLDVAGLERELRAAAP